MLIGAAAGLAGVLLFAVLAQIGMRYMGVSVLRSAPEALSERLKPAYRISHPQGEGPFPTALLASGCDGPADNLDRWTAALNEIGWAAIVVDSHHPRGYGTDPAWRLVCTGAALPGGARAGDLAVAMADARAMPFVDATRLALIGASHGGWAVLDLLALADAGRRPENLTRWPDAPGEDPLSGLVAVAAIYPYCGNASRVGKTGWRRDVPVLIAVVEGDSIIDETDCIAIAERGAAAGLPVSVLRVSGATHGFDQQQKSAFSTLRYDAEATERLLLVLRQFFANAAIR